MALEEIVMGWAGSGALLAWHDVEPGRERDYQHWHTHEHMEERLSVPGFQQGRRYSVVGDGPAFLIIYEVDSMAVFSSSPYLDRLNNPTEWTKRIMPALLRMNRSLCRVVMSAGIGAGRFMQTIRFSPEQGREAELRDALQHELRSLVNAGRLCAAHLLVADRGSSAVATREKELRGGRDAVADWVLLVEGYDQQAVAENRTARLTRSGAHPAIADHLYTLDHLVSLRPPGSA